MFVALECCCLVEGEKVNVTDTPAVHVFCIVLPALLICILLVVARNFSRKGRVEEVSSSAHSFYFAAMECMCLFVCMLHFLNTKTELVFQGSWFEVFRNFNENRFSCSRKVRKIQWHGKGKQTFFGALSLQFDTPL